mmetsp:Transcript_10534/g.17675  ORF Transcript_10534/g.17675 Transcript_10534/m.17675 type:complete len:126 (+) Transcript_10534:529-906(+)
MMQPLDFGMGGFEPGFESHMARMHDDFARMEREMSDSFNRGLEMARAAPEELARQGGNVKSESYSSKSEMEMGPDGKMKKDSRSQGHQMECKDGVCKKVTCKDGECKESVFNASTGQLVDKSAPE